MTYILSHDHILSLIYNRLLEQKRLNMIQVSQIQTQPLCKLCLFAKTCNDLVISEVHISNICKCKLPNSQDSEHCIFTYLIV